MARPHFDVDGARKAGFNDTQIADFLAGDNNFDAAAARQAGYNDLQIIGELNKPPEAEMRIVGTEKLGKPPGIPSPTLPGSLGGGPAGYRPPPETPALTPNGAGPGPLPGIPEPELPIGLGGTKAPFSTAYDPYKRVGRALPNQVFGAPLQTDVGEAAKLRAKVAPGYLPDDDTLVQGFMGPPKPEPLPEDAGYIDQIKQQLDVGRRQVVSSAISGGEALARRASVALPPGMARKAAEAVEWQLGQANTGRPEEQQWAGVKELASDDQLTLDKVGKYAARSTAQALPSIGATVAASLLPGGKFAGAALSYLMSVGELYENNVNAGVHPDEAAKIAGLAGGPSAALDYLEPFRIAAALKGKATKELLKDTYKALGLMRRAGKATAEGLVESGTEMGQELIGILSEWYGTGKAPGLNDALWRLTEAGVGAFGAGAGGGTIQQVSEARHSNAMRDVADYIDKRAAKEGLAAPGAAGGPLPTPGVGAPGAAAPAPAPGVGAPEVLPGAAPGAPPAAGAGVPTVVPGAPGETLFPPPGAPAPGAVAAGPAADTAPPRPLFDDPEQLYQDAVQFASGFRQLGVTALVKKYGITRDDAHAILERFVEDGNFATKPLKDGGVSYVNLALQREAREIDPATGKPVRSPITKKGATEEAASQFIPPGEGEIPAGTGPDVSEEQAPLPAAATPEQQAPPKATPDVAAIAAKSEERQEQQAPPAQREPEPPSRPAPADADYELIQNAPFTQEQKYRAFELLEEGRSVEDAMDLAYHGPAREEAPAAPAPVQAKEEAPQRPEPRPSASEQAPPPAPAAQAPWERQQQERQEAAQEPLEAAKAPEEEPAKEPWQLTQAELNAQGYIGHDTKTGKPIVVKSTTTGREAANASEHERVVAAAVNRGLPVPAHVLAEYPNITPPKVGPAPTQEPLAAAKPPEATSRILAADLTPIFANPKKAAKYQKARELAENAADPDRAAHARTIVESMEAELSERQQERILQIEMGAPTEAPAPKPKRGRAAPEQAAKPPEEATTQVEAPSTQVDEPLKPSKNTEGLSPEYQKVIHDHFDPNDPGVKLEAVIPHELGSWPVYSHKGDATGKSPSSMPKGVTSWFGHSAKLKTVKQLLAYVKTYAKNNPSGSAVWHIVTYPKNMYPPELWVSDMGKLMRPEAYKDYKGPEAAAKPIEKEAPSEAKAEEGITVPAGDESEGGQTLQQRTVSSGEGEAEGGRREGGVQGRDAASVEPTGKEAPGKLDPSDPASVRAVSIAVLADVSRGVIKSADGKVTAEAIEEHLVDKYGAEKGKAAAQQVHGQVQQMMDNPVAINRMEASTTQPKGKNAVGHPITGLVVTGKNNAVKDRKAFAKAVALMNKYANFRDIKAADIARQLRAAGVAANNIKFAVADHIAEKMINRIVDNLLWLHDEYHRLGFADRAKLWYDGGRKKAEANAKEYGVTVHQAAATLAVFSPEKDWFQNVDMARRFHEWWTNRKTLKWTPEMEAIFEKKIWPKKVEQDKKTLAKREIKNAERRAKGLPEKAFVPSKKLETAYAAIKGKGASDVSDTFAQAVWFRLWDEAHNDRSHRVLTPEGEYAGYALTGEEGDTDRRNAKVAWSSYNPMMKAIRVMKDGSFKNVSKQLGERHKVRNFYNNLLDPNNPNGHVTSDTHAVAAGLMQPLGGSAPEVEHNLGKGASSAATGEQGTYWMFAEAYRRAARERNILPREMQSITWEAVRGLFKGQKTEGNIALVKGLWDDAINGKITPAEARGKINEHFKGIQAPAWAGTRPGERGGSPGVHEGTGPADDKGGVSEPVASGGGPGGTPVSGGGDGPAGGVPARVGKGRGRGRSVVDALLRIVPPSLRARIVTNASTIRTSLLGSDYTFKTESFQTGIAWANRDGIEFIGHLTKDPNINGVSLGGPKIDILITHIEDFINKPTSEQSQVVSLQPLLDGMEKWRAANPGPDASLNFSLEPSPLQKFSAIRQTAREELIHGFQRLRRITQSVHEPILRTPLFEKARLELIRQGYGPEVEILPTDTADEKAVKDVIAWMEITAKVLSGDTMRMTLAEREDIAYEYREALIKEHGPDATVIFRYLKAGVVKDVFQGKAQPWSKQAVTPSLFQQWVQAAATAAAQPAVATQTVAEMEAELAALEAENAKLKAGPKDLETELAELMAELERLQAEEKKLQAESAASVPSLGRKAEPVLRAKQQPPQGPQTTQAVTTTQQQGQQQQGQGQQQQGPTHAGAGTTTAQRFDTITESMEPSRQSDEKTRLQKLGEEWTKVKNAVTRQFHHIPAGALYAEFKQKLNFVSKAQGTSIHKAAQSIINQLEKLDKDEYTKFLHVVVFDDLAARVIQSIKEQKPVLAQDLPWGLTDARELINMKTEARNRARGNPKIVEALRQRKAMWDKIKPEYVRAMKRAGVDVSKAVSRKDYFRHRVQKHLEVKEAIGGGGTGAGQRYKLPTARSWMKKAEVNKNVYSLDYIRSEFEVLSEMMYDTERANFIGWLRNDSGHDVAPQLKRMAAAHNKAQIMPTFARMARYYNKKNPRAPRQTAEMVYQKVMKLRPRDPSWRQRVTKRLAGAEYVGSLEAAYNKLTLPNGNKALDTHELYQANEKEHFFLAATIPDSMAAAIEANGQGTVTADKIRKIKAKGQRQGQMVLPREVIETMKEFMQPPTTQWEQFTDKWTRRPLAWWKQAKLIHPVSFVKYNLRNLSGDLERVLITNPKALKHVKRATAEIYEFMRTGKMSPAFEEWWKRGGMDANLQVAEIGEVNRLKKLMHLKLEDPKAKSKTEKGADAAAKGWNAVWGTTRAITDFREGILRYATFLEYQQQVHSNTNGRPNNFGASKREEVMAIRNLDDRAYKLSNDLMLAYDEVSVAGQTLRRHLIPFWSFQEKNAQAYKRMVVNSYKDGRTSAAIGYAALGGAATALRVGVWTAAKVGKTLALSLALKTLTELWNHSVMDDEEEDLPEAVKKSTHLILGRDSHGKVIAFTRLGTADDLLEWGGLEAAPYYVREYLNGRMSYEDLAKEIAFRPFGIPLPVKPAINKVMQSITPGIKTTTELISGRAWFPNIFEQREIRDRYEYIARELGLQTPYKWAAGRPQPKTLTDPSRLLDLVVYRYDPNETHYNAFKYDKIAKWGAEHGADLGGGLSQKKAAQALYDIRMAVRYRDDDARDLALHAYGEAGGTQQNLRKSIDRLHPLGSLKKSLRADYMKSLSPKEAANMKKAIKFWEDNFNSQWSDLEAAASKSKLPEKRKK